VRFFGFKIPFQIVFKHGFFYRKEINLIAGVLQFRWEKVRIFHLVSQTIP